jgi:hypothetical protein
MPLEKSSQEHIAENNQNAGYEVEAVLFKEGHQIIQAFIEGGILLGLHAARIPIFPLVIYTCCDKKFEMILEIETVPFHGSIRTLRNFYS